MVTAFEIIGVFPDKNGILGRLQLDNTSGNVKSADKNLNFGAILIYTL